ncbi:hypothetical protein CRG98_039695 [Punica granatum]|uniref:Uncharacterized protein n=1 Tax=Punica granatum TaxID=22663 RepID=A0A2I0I961_PUNGR|nr:hypothetical protein CRG98_039695 [Punica granatum]
MSRSGRDYLLGGRNFPPGSLNHRRGHSLTAPRDADENLDLFSRNRRSVSVAPSEESSDASTLKLGRLSVGLAKVARNGLDDLLSSTDGGKHDYDWLLTPPGTPLFASSDGREPQGPQPTTAVPRSSSLARSSSTTKASRLSVSQSESSHTSRPARSSSVTRSSISSSQYSNYSSNRSSSILNTSSASISSYIRPSSPITRSSSTARPSTPSTRSSNSRPSTPSRVRTGPTSSSIEKPRPTQSSRPSTPSSRPQIPANMSVPASRSNSRPSTPTRRNSAPSLSQSVSSISVGRALSNGRTTTPSSRPSSPGPRPRPPPQPIVPPDFPLETPPNLRTTLPDRPLSAGRSRPGASVTAKGNTDPAGSANLSRRQPSPIVTRGRLSVPEPSGRARVHSHAADPPEHRKAPHSPELGMRRPVKTPTSAPDSNGFGRTISKKSLDMAIRHMDIRNGTGSLRALSNTTLFPQSIRSTGSKTHSSRSLNASVNGNGNHQSSNDALSESGSWNVRSPDNSTVSGNGNYSAKLTEVDIYESSRYDAILLKEDLKNTNWLHSVDDKSDQGLIFDNGFEPLPEPFGPL